MESKKPAKRSKLSQLPLNCQMTSGDVLCGTLTPNSSACVVNLVLAPPSLPQKSPSHRILRSPRRSLKRCQLSPLLLPQIGTVNDAVDDECPSNTEDHHEQGRYPYIPAASRILKPMFKRRLENLNDIGVEFDYPDDNFGSVRVDEVTPD